MIRAAAMLYIDDLQWVDTASLQLIELILTTLKTEGLLLIGAYRNNEVTPMHPFMTATQRIIRTIVLGNDAMKLMLNGAPVKFRSNCADGCARGPLAHFVLHPLYRRFYSAPSGVRR